MGLIYKITSRTSGKSYIGLTSWGLHKRWNRHKSVAKDKRYKYHFYRAIRKYGVEDFCVMVLEDNLYDVALGEKEKYYIKLFDSYYSGYNMTLGGEGFGSKPGKVVTEETKVKLRAITLKQHRDHPEHAINSSKFNSGKVVCKSLTTGLKYHVTREVFDKNSDLVGVNTGRKLSEEHKANISEGGKGRKLSETHKKALSKLKRADFKVFDSNNKVMYTKMSSREVQGICRSLYGKTKDNRLGATVASKQQLNKQGKLHLIGWYTEKEQNEK